MKEQDIKLSIVTINYNGYKDTCELIDSLKKNLSVSYEIIVVDNASANDEASMLALKYSDIKVIKSPNNSGFSGGNNLGIKCAKGAYIMLLNNDTVIEDDSFIHLIERLESAPDIGVVSPKIKFAFAPRNIQFAGFTPLSRITLRNHTIGYDMPDQKQYDTARETPYAHGAAMMLKRRVIEEVGLMPEIYFLYYEELDWCTHITDQGWKIWYEPKSTVYHKESRATGQNSPLKIKYLTRNRLLYAYRNRKNGEKFISLAYQLCIAAPKGVIQFLIAGKTQLSNAIISGCVEFFKLNK